MTAGHIVMLALFSTLLICGIILIDSFIREAP